MQSKLKAFVQLESFTGILLFFAAITGLLLANSPWQSSYQKILYHYQALSIINDGLMTIFFLLAGCEIKREILYGELNSRRKIRLPIIAAVFGMAIPAIIYLLFNIQDKKLCQGWAIPSATDIAFALGVLSLLGKRIPLSLKALLTAIAIFDDAGAILIIAFFYTSALNFFYCLAAGLIYSGLFILNNFSVQKLKFYILLGGLLWYLLLKSGIHPTIAGVLLAAVIPGNKLLLIEKYLHPWSTYCILPLFALANSGISFETLPLSASLFSTLSLGIIAGLFLGKQLGIFSAIWLSIHFKIAALPKQSNFIMLYGMSLLCGIGFTMSLFIGSLAFHDPDLINTVRIGVISGSFLSACAGYFLLRHQKPGVRFPSAR